ncbi:MAG: hypothetical protein U0R64_10470 [Candidatus Nanopelagicales bacterium]
MTGSRCSRDRREDRCALLSRYGDLTSALAAAAADDPGIAAGSARSCWPPPDYLAAADPVVRLTHRRPPGR